MKPSIRIKNNRVHRKLPGHGCCQVQDTERYNILYYPILFKAYSNIFISGCYFTESVVHADKLNPKIHEKPTRNIGKCHELSCPTKTTRLHP
jgi:hypothetical protein